MNNEVKHAVQHPLLRDGLSLGSISALLLLAIMWGLSIPATKLGLQTAPPLTLTAMRFAVAAPLFLFLVAGKERLPWRALPKVATLGALGISVGQVAQALGVNDTSASVGTIISATIPVFVVVFAALRLKQSVTGWQQVGLFAAFVGIALVALGSEQGHSTTSGNSLTGAAWLLLSAISIAFYYVWSIEITSEFGTVSVAAWSTLFGFIVMLPFAGWEMWHTPFNITAQAIGVAAYLGVVVTVAGLFLWLHLLRTVPARIAASVQYLQPVVGIGAASALFGDQLGLLFFLGVLLILIGLTLAVATRPVPAKAVPHE